MRERGRRELGKKEITKAGTEGRGEREKEGEERKREREGN